MAMKYTLDEALEKFEKQLTTYFFYPNNLKSVEITDYKINTFLGMQRAINAYEKNVPLWQHSKEWHTAMIYIYQGNGFQFNRNMLDLIRNGINSSEKFVESWKETNNGEWYGIMPRTTNSVTSSERRKQASYILANLNKEPNPNSKLGSIYKNIPHRTHLISSQVTGIENDKGLLIDYDGWLNSIPMNRFETEILEETERRSLVWVANVWRENDGLHLKYTIYNTDWTIYREQEWIDDRWEYVWRYDGYQTNLTDS